MALQRRGRRGCGWPAREREGFGVALGLLYRIRAVRRRMGATLSASGTSQSETGSAPRFV